MPIIKTGVATYDREPPTGNPYSKDSKGTDITLARQMTAELIDQLRPYASCDVRTDYWEADPQIADALQRLKYPMSGFLPDLVLHSPTFQSGDTKVIGEVSTVKV